MLGMIFSIMAGPRRARFPIERIIPMPKRPLDLAAAISALDSEHIKDISYSWVIDEADTPAKFQRALSSILGRLLPLDYRSIRGCVEDREYHQQLLAALQPSDITMHLATYLGIDSATVTDEHKAQYLFHLCSTVVDYGKPGNTERLLQRTLGAGPGYATFSLASDMWSEGLNADRVTTNWMAVCLRSTALLLGLTLQPPTPLPAWQLPLPPRDLGPVLRSCLLQPPGQGPLFTRLNQRLQSGFLHHRRLFARRLTAREIRQGALPHGCAATDPVVREQTLLDRPIADALQALLYSRGGQALGQALLDDLQWLDNGGTPAFQHDLRAAVTAQAITDMVFPRGQRKAGHIGPFDLFDDAQHNGSEVLTDLSNDLHAHLDCIEADAQWLAALTLVQQAPELLLRDIPENFRYEQSFRLVNLRHGLTLLARPSQHLSFAEAEAAPALHASLAKTPLQQAQFAAQRSPAILSWAEHHGVIAQQPAYSPRQIEAVTLQYDALCATAVLAEAPSRVFDAAQRLLEAGIDAYGPVKPAADKPGQRPPTTQVEAYLDNGSDYRHAKLGRQRLPNPSSAFDALFDLYAYNARALYRQLCSVFLEQLPSAHLDRLRSARLRFCTVQWHEYIGMASAPPSRQTSDPSQWRQRPSTGGLMVLAEQHGHTWVYQLFPKQLTHRVILLSEAQQAQVAIPELIVHVLDNLVPMAHADFHLGEPLPYNYSTLADIVVLPDTPGDNLQHCVDALVEHALLARLDELRAVCRGQTPLEKAKAAWAARSDGEYAWKLIKNTVPFVGCADVRGASDLASCLLDIVPDVGIRLGALSRLFASAHRFSRSARLALGKAPMSRASKQVAEWMAPAAGNAMRRQLHAISQGTPQGNFVQQQGMSRVPPGLEQPTGLAPRQQLASVDNLDQVLVSNVGSDTTPLYRLQHAATLAVYGPPLVATGNGSRRTFLSARTRIGQGHYPSMVRLDVGSDRMPLLPLEPNTQVRIIERERGRFDVLVDGHHYQVDTLLAPQHLRKRQHVEIARQTEPYEYQWVACRRKRGLDLKLDPTCVDHVQLRSASPPPAPAEDAIGGIGILMSEAHPARRFDLERRAVPSPSTALALELDLMVHEGKFVKWANTAKPGRPAESALQPLNQSELTALGLPEVPTYRETLTARWSNEHELGFPVDADAVVVRSLNESMPHLAFRAISHEVNDARVLRAHRVPISEHHFVLHAEVDDCRFFTAGPFSAAELKVQDRVFEFRPSSDEYITQCVELNHSYAMVRNKLASAHDCENIARLLFDIDHYHARKLGPPLSPNMPSSYEALLASPAHEHLHKQFQLLAQEILTSNASQELYVRMVRGIIPQFNTLANFPLTRQQAVASRLNALLPVRNKSTPDWLTLTVDNLGLEATGKAILKNIGYTNLAFAEVTLEGGQTLVYYALSGKKAARKLQLRLDVEGQPRMGSDPHYIDARRLMQDAAPDPSFSNLPVVPDIANLKVRAFPREQDSERFIVTVLRQDLLGAAANGRVVKEIHLFTLFDTCRTCGGVLMPRLRLDFPDAEFSVSYLLSYDVARNPVPSRTPSTSP